MFEVHPVLFLCTTNLFCFRMSSAAALGTDWLYDADLDKVTFSFRALEKHSRPNKLRHNLLLDNGPPGIQVNIFG